ncbi:MAG: UDP-glucose/GDP-mannose dehydrogenase family protein [Bacteroidales bacterium]|nr:UDP-glucose/GDP-mannose dehydrogenase family protein [Bacteroidales bacterium]MDD4528576.1 UDP-glucose/GDP-mannose dehydrogenase family protein [Bacteroidales bacterium]MDD4829121.1 UDP-glucose/GDP-mannose dehydrogenase family protein [Bacteroidales bacterium]
MRTVIVGTGYVGLVTGTCFAEMGIDVICVDIDHKKIENLRKGISPIYEPGLDELIEKNVAKGRLKFSTNIADCIEGTDVIFSAVGTPPDEDGSADLKYVLDVAKQIGENMNNYCLVVTKSTVPVGTAQKVKKAIQDELDKRGKNIDFDIASNPEFLKEGNAVKDFLSPDRIVVGVESQKAEEIMTRLYKPFTLNGHNVIYMDVPSAEMTKYAANAMLAVRISFMNEVANLCEKVGANVNMVRKGIGSDPRIGSKFLYSGIGYGGSCFPKDVKALYKTGLENDIELRVVKAAEDTNDEQKLVLFNKLKAIYPDLNNKTIAIWGLSFKPETDDMREAPSLYILNALSKQGCKIRVYDPIAMEETKRRLQNIKIEYCQDEYEVVENADALLLLTEWKEFRLPNWEKVKKSMNKLVLLDGRNIYEGKEMRELGFYYEGIGTK